MSNEVKTCRICGKMYTLDHFRSAYFSPDGHAHICKDCEKTRRKHTQIIRGGVSKVTKALDTNATNPAFTGISSRTLIEELKARGYKWDRMWTEEVKVEKRMVVI